MEFALYDGSKGSGHTSPMHDGWTFRNPNAPRRPLDQQANGEDQPGHPVFAEMKQMGPDDRDALPADMDVQSSF